MQKILSGMSHYFGLNVSGERLGSPEAFLAREIEQTTNNSQPIAELLQYESYDDRTQTFFNRDGTAGFCFEINPKIGHDHHIEKNLKLFFNDELPKQGFLQFLIVASHDISILMSLWESGGDRGGAILQELCQHRKDFLQQKAINFQDAADGVLARNYRSFVCYSCKAEDITNKKYIEEAIYRAY